MLGFLSVMVRPAAGRPVRTRDVVFILVVSVADGARNRSLRLVVVWYRGVFRSIDNSSSCWKQQNNRLSAFVFVGDVECGRRGLFELQE